CRPKSSSAVRRTASAQRRTSLLRGRRPSGSSSSGCCIPAARSSRSGETPWAAAPSTMNWHMRTDTVLMKAATPRGWDHVRGAARAPPAYVSGASCHCFGGRAWVLSQCPKHIEEEASIMAISDLMILVSDNNTTFAPTDWKRLDQDLNQGAGGKFI